MPVAHPFLDGNFHIRWSLLTAERIVSDITLGLEKAQANIDRLCELSGEDLTFEKTLLGYEDALRELESAWGKIAHLDMVRNSPDLREAHNAMLPKISAFRTGITLNSRLWALFLAYSKTDEARSLSGERRRFLDETLADFVENGANLADDDKAKLEKLNSELAEITQKFSENVLDSTNARERIVTDESLLAGLPESARAAALQSAKSKNLATDEKRAWRFTLHSPSLLPVMKFAESDELRRELREASLSVGRVAPYDNTAIIRRIVKLRDEKARLLGKACFADYTTARRMAGTGEAALRFVESLHRRTKPAFDRETAELESYAAEKRGGEAGRLKPWEIVYWSEKQRREKYAFDTEALRPYFAVGSVQSGLFEICRRLFGITVKRRATLADGVVFPSGSCEEADGPPVEVWHPEVKFFEIHDGGTHIGSFYADWFPRESKRGGAWMNSFITGGPREDGSFAPHLGLMCGNFTPPVDGAEALLSHDEVETIFHEFGHLLHHILSAVKIESLAGVRVAWDFVELPSQLLENWCWRKESLDLFARHHETGEPIPEDMLVKLVRSGNHRAASVMMSQLANGKLDLDLHMRAAELVDADLDDHWSRELADYQIPTTESATSLAPRFTHIFSDATGYAAGYYSYKWAEALDADAFTRFDNEGVLNPDTGRALRETIFSKGNSEPPGDLFRRFMGRDPDPEALFRRAGIG